MDVSRLRFARDRSGGREPGILVSRGGTIPDTLRVREPWTAGMYELILDDERCRLFGVVGYALR